MKLNLNKNKRYILGCSFGPDSMALFYLLLNGNYDFVVCNIDYNYREGSIEETEGIRRVCEEKNVPFYTKNVQFSPIFHNFEAWARKIRYDFFKEIGTKLGIYNILVAHQQDDLIETYFMQKKRGSFVTFFGLKKRYKIGDFYIIRPLLNYRKIDLKNYCDKHCYSYILDPTNLDENYLRNYYRNEIVLKLNKDERKKIINDIKEENLKNKLSIEKAEKIVKNHKYISVKEASKLSIEELYISIIKLLENFEIRTEFSKKSVNELFKNIKNFKKWEVKIDEENYLLKDEKYITVININFNYSFEFNEQNYQNNYFKLNLNELTKKYGKHENFIVNPAETASFYEISGFKKKINRIFIDWKMPPTIRKRWPGIFDENGNLLYIPRYRSNLKYNDKSLLKFKENVLFSITK